MTADFALETQKPEESDATFFKCNSKLYIQQKYPSGMIGKQTLSHEGKLRESVANRPTLQK